MLEMRIRRNVVTVRDGKRLLVRAVGEAGYTPVGAAATLAAEVVSAEAQERRADRQVVDISALLGKFIASMKPKPASHYGRVRRVSPALLKRMGFGKGVKR